MNSLNKIVAAAVIGSGILGLESCKKYEDGPAFSLRSKKARLTGEWQVISSQQGEIANALNTGVDIIVEFKKDGQFSATGTWLQYGYPLSYIKQGEWEWTSKKERVEVVWDNPAGSIVYFKALEKDQAFEIKRLTNDELNFEDDYGYDWEMEKL